MGTANGINSKVVQVNVVTGDIIGRLTFSNDIHDVTLAGDYLYVYTVNALYVVSNDNGLMNVIGSVALSGGVNSSIDRMRLFVGGDIAYTIHSRGYSTVDVKNPAQPNLIAHQLAAQFGWKDIAINGSGVGIAAVGANSILDGPHHIARYDVSNPTNVDQFVTEHQTPGIARAVSIYNGLVYVTDDTSGLQVINYLSYDTAGNAPFIVLSANFSLNPAQAEEGKRVRVAADVNDDVQVRNVEFYIDDVKVATDGNFPFEHHFITPRLVDQQTFSLKARASDTGANVTW